MHIERERERGDCLGFVRERKRWVRYKLLVEKVGGLIEEFVHVQIR